MKITVKKIIIALVVAALLITPMFLGDYLLIILINGLILCYLSQCWNLLGGYAGQLSMGHSFFYGIGAYVSTMMLLKGDISPWIGMIVGGIVSAGFAFIIGALVFRYKIKGIFFALITIALCEITRSIANNIDYIGSSAGVLLPLENNPASFLFLDRHYYYYIILAFVALIAYATYKIEKSVLGYYLMAIKENEEAASASGINVNKYKIIILCISAFATAIGGTFYAQFMLFISPDVIFSLTNTTNMILSTMVGGMGTVFGPILGAAIFSFVGEVLRSLSFGQGTQAVTLTSAIYGVMLVVVALYFPKGIINIGKKVKNKKINELAFSLVKGVKKNARS